MNRAASSSATGAIRSSSTTAFCCAVLSNGMRFPSSEVTDGEGDTESQRNGRRLRSRWVVIAKGVGPVAVAVHDRAASVRPNVAYTIGAIPPSSGRPSRNKATRDVSGQGRRSRRRASHGGDVKSGDNKSGDAKGDAKGSVKGGAKEGTGAGQGRRRTGRMRTVDETSAGGLVVDIETGRAAVIGRLDRRRGPPSAQDGAPLPAAGAGWRVVRCRRGGHRGGLGAVGRSAGAVGLRRRAPPGPSRHRDARGFGVRRRLHSITAAFLFAVLGLLTVGVPLAQAQQRQMQQPQRPNVLARLQLAGMSPRVVTVSSGPVLRVEGRVVNVGDRPITKLAVRLQRDAPLISDDAATRAVAVVPEAPQVTLFQPVPGDLAPGQDVSFRLEVPLRGGADLESLQINEPGVYPVLVNLNGKPEFGGTARLASVPLLLPVLGIPPVAAGQPSGPVLGPPTQSMPLTVVWPLAAEPARLPTGPGEPILIRSDPSGADPVAADIAPGGRLDGLLGALEQVVPPGSPLAAAVCVAIDPALVETVDGMSRGYRV